MNENTDEHTITLDLELSILLKGGKQGATGLLQSFAVGCRFLRDLLELVITLNDLCIEGHGARALMCSFRRRGSGDILGFESILVAREEGAVVALELPLLGRDILLPSFLKKLLH